MGLCLLELLAKLVDAGKNHIWLKLGMEKVLVFFSEYK